MFKADSTTSAPVGSETRPRHNLWHLWHGKADAADDRELVLSGFRSLGLVVLRGLGSSGSCDFCVSASKGLRLYGTALIWLVGLRGHHRHKLPEDRGPKPRALETLSPNGPHSLTKFQTPLKPKHPEA